MTEPKQTCNVSKNAYAFTSDTQRQRDTIPFIWPIDCERQNVGMSSDATKLRSLWTNRSEVSGLICYRVTVSRHVLYFYHKSFAVSCNLKVHERVHASHTQCGKSFRHSNTVENHRKKNCLKFSWWAKSIHPVSFHVLYLAWQIYSHTVKVIAAFLHAIKKIVQNSMKNKTV